MKKFKIVVFLFTVCMFFTSCGLKQVSSENYYKATAPRQYVFDAFDTQCSISIYGITDDFLAEEYAEDMKSLIYNYELAFSKNIEDSDIYNINHRTSDSVMIRNETATIFEIASDLYAWSNNKFDISLGTLINLWDIKNRTTIPSLEEINEARRHTGNFKYNIEHNIDPNSEFCDKITFFGDSNTQYDLGGLIKGYCCDALKEMLSENKDISACIVNLGGNVLVTGEVDSRKNGAFNIGIFKPFSGNEVIETLEVKNRNVITSGDYQRYFKVEGDDRIYHHIIDPITGYPTDNNLDSVTIVSENGLLGDYLSTSCMLLGENASKSLIDFASKTFNDKNIQAIFVRKDGTVSKYPENVKIK